MTANAINSNTAQLDGADIITTQGDFVLQALSDDTVNSSTDSSGGGAVDIGSSNTTTNVSYQTLADVGQGSQITAASGLEVESQSNTTGTGNSTSDGSGLGVGAHANDYLYLGSPSDDSNAATTLTTIESGAALVAEDTTVNAITTYNIAANSISLASAFAAATTSNSIADANETSNVSILPGATITGTDSVDIDAENNENSDVANAGSHCDAAFGSATSTSTTNIFGPSYFAGMTVTPGDTSTTEGELTLVSNGPVINSISGDAVDGLFGSNSPSKKNSSVGTTITGSKPAQLTIGSSNDTLDLNVTPTKGASRVPIAVQLSDGTYTASSLATMLQQVIDQMMAEYFNASPSPVTGLPQDMSEVDAAAGATIVTPALSVQALATFAAVQENDDSSGGFIVGHYDDYDGIAAANRTIHWNSNVVSTGPQDANTLYINANGTVNKSLSTITPTFDGNEIIVPDIGGLTGGGTIDFYANPLNDYLFASQETEDSNLGLIDGNEATFYFQDTAGAVRLINASKDDMVVNNIDLADAGAAPTNPNVTVYVNSDNVNNDAFAFNVVSEPAPTLVDIENTSKSGAPNIILDGSINNPIGTTEILNTSGSIETAGQRSEIVTNILNVEAPKGSIGTITDMLYADLVQSEDVNGVQRPIQVTVLAGVDAYLNITGILRDPAINPNTTSFIIPLSSIQTGGNVIAFLEESVQQSAPGTANSGIIVYEPFTDTTTPVTTHFRPDGTGTESPGDPGFFDSNSTLINSTYDFASLTAGGNIVLIGIPTEGSNNVTPVIGITGFTNINPNATSIGQISASTNGNIALTETVGDMRVGNITSTGGNVSLTVPNNAVSGDDLVMTSGSSVTATGGSVTIDVADNVTIPTGSYITAGLTALIQGDYGKNAGVTGSVISISGQIFAPQPMSRAARTTTRSA